MLTLYVVQTNKRIDFARLREEALQKTEALQKSAEPVLKVIENPEVADRLKGAVDKQRNMELLQKEYNVRFVCVSSWSGERRG
jgi:hypothetical protein